MPRRTSDKPRQADPCTLVIFGASGDLTHRLLMPALCHLATANLLPDGFNVIGVSRAPYSDAQFRAHIDKGLKQFAGGKPSAATRHWLLSRLSYIAGDFDDERTFAAIRGALAERRRAGHGNVLFYLATPPSLFAPLSEALGHAGFAKQSHGAWSRLIVEKPFGTDLASARTLNRRILADFAEEQVYRIDHFLGKETVQNILALRFANNLFESLWNREHIDHVQITVAESIDVGTRGGFYDATGALRDMVPNHLFQLMSLIAMDPPSRFGADAVRTEKTKALQAVQAYDAAGAANAGVRGQYRGGRVNGKAVRAYRSTQQVARGSDTETYVAMKLMIENWRWAGVPFYLRTGKALRARKTEIAVRFRDAPFRLFRDTPTERLVQNFVIVQIAPDEGVSIRFNAKVPGPQLRMQGVNMDFKYKDYFAAVPNNGYETLIYDCMIGDQTLFQHADDVEAAWGVVQPFLDGWRHSRGKGLGFYAAGSDGPEAADDLLARDGRRWRPIGGEPAK